MACGVLGGLQYSLSALGESDLECLSPSDSSLDDNSIGRIRTDRLRDYQGLFDAVPFTPSQGVCANSPHVMKNKNMFSPFANSFRSGIDNANPVLGGAASDGSTASDISGGLATSPVGGLSGYSPFMGMPWSNNMNNYLSEAPAGPHLEIPESPMSPGLLFNPTPSPGALGAPGSPRALFGSQSPTPFLAGSGAGVAGLRTSTGSLQLPSSFANTTASANLAAAAAAADAAAAAAALNSQLPSFYYQAAAAAAGGAGSAAANNALLQAALSQTLAAQQHQQQQMQQQILQASLSAAFSQAAANPYLQGYPSAVLSALEPMRSAGGSLSLDGGLQQQASMNAAAAVLLQQQQQQQVHAAAQLRRNLSTPAAVAAQLQLNNAAAAAASAIGLQSPLTASASALSPLSAQMSRLHAAHSADLSHLDAAALLGGAGMGGMSAARSKSFKARKNSEPKIGPDGQPRLNARQRRTLRRAKERALKGLLEVSQALLQKAEVQVTVPNISHLTALEELAAAEAEKELAAGNAPAGEGCLSPSSSVSASASNGSANPTATGGVTRSQQLAAAAAAVEESVCEIARAAVAAVTAQATGKDTRDAAAAAQAAAANAASAAASAGAVLPAYMMKPEGEEPNSDELPGPNDSVDILSHSAPNSPVGSNVTVTDASSGRSSSSSSTGCNNRCSSSGSAVSASSGKPPKAAIPAASGASAGASSPLPAGKSRPGSQLEGIDIAGLIGQLSLKKDEGMVDDKLIRDLQIIQSLIGALKAPAGSGGLEAVTAGCPTSLSSGGGSGRSIGGRSAGSSGGSKAHMVRRANSYSPSSGVAL